MNFSAKLNLLPLAAIALAGLTTIAAAQVTPEQQSAIRGNCRSDFQSKCSGVTPGGKDALACLQKNVAGLSAGCKAAVSATIPVPAKPAEAAPAPAPAAPPPPKAAVAPASAPAPVQAAPLAPAPAAKPVIVNAPPPPAAKPKSAAAPKKPAPPAVVAAPPVATPAATVDAATPMPTPQQVKAIKFTCRKDFATYCKGVPQGGPAALACLQRNNTRLLPDCKTSLADAGDGLPPPAPVAPAPTTRTPNAPVVMTAVIGRSCARDLILHCRDIKVGDGQKIACLMARGPKLSVLCKAALKITAPVR